MTRDRRRAGRLYDSHKDWSWLHRMVKDECKRRGRALSSWETCAFLRDRGIVPRGRVYAEAMRALASLPERFYGAA